jgi:NTE family protein
MAMLFSPVSPLGAEARVTLGVGSEPTLQAEYYRPLDLAGRWFTLFQGGYTNPNIHVFEDGHDIASYDVRLLGVQAKFGREFGNYGAATLGVDRAAGRADVEIGDPTLPSYDFQQGDLSANVTVDRLDSLFFPQRGYLASLGYNVSRDWLGSDAEYDQLDFDAIGAKSFGRHAVQLGARYHVTLSGTLPVQSLYRLGVRW